MSFSNSGRASNGADQRQETEAGHDPVTSGHTNKGASDNKVSGILADRAHPRHFLNVGQFLAVGFTERGALAVAVFDSRDPQTHGVLGLFPAQVAEGSGRAVGTVFARRAAKVPERALEPLRERREALAAENQSGMGEARLG